MPDATGTLGSAVVVYEGAVHVMCWHPNKGPTTLCEIQLPYGTQASRNKEDRVDCMACIGELLR